MVRNRRRCTARLSGYKKTKHRIDTLYQSVFQVWQRNCTFLDKSITLQRNEHFFYLTTRKIILVVIR